ncbi:unnamed protein product [Vitrella brassicaformis CCMP3155]|uniref:Uncharacterized protein n=1 Tax=Vitrella brassicaformis (strain CCMP3155) TaxID=1169540 RepID=A0A0G4FA37_VITBC|nr:unnamed protein product [Vitrella brassicaformis CCMP3155]|eukprot:CEM09787.1 unnamed protein product [Vitrella brassicaformis CCMP3155]
MAREGQRSGGCGGLAITPFMLLLVLTASCALCEVSARQQDAPTGLLQLKKGQHKRHGHTHRHGHGSNRQHQEAHERAPALGVDQFDSSLQRAAPYDDTVHTKETATNNAAHATAASRPQQQQQQQQHITRARAPPSIAVDTTDTEWDEVIDDTKDKGGGTAADTGDREAPTEMDLMASRNRGGVKDSKSEVVGLGAAAVDINKRARPKGYDTCLSFASMLRDKGVVGVELVKTWRNTCQPAIESGVASDSYGIMCASLGGAVEPFAQDTNYDAGELCHAVLKVFHDLTAGDAPAPATISAREHAH